MTDLTLSAPWQALIHHQQLIEPYPISHWFKLDPTRSSRFTLKIGSLSLDYSRHHLNDDTLSLLFDLANSVQLRQCINRLFSGDIVNPIENRPALHTALRDRQSRPLLVNNINITPLIQATKDRLFQFTQAIHAGIRRGVTGKPFKTIVNIGIGGSHVGPQMAVQALKDFAVTDLKFLFISSIDPAHFQDTLEEIDWETTLFIVSSKSFTTVETLTNANSIKQFLLATYGAKGISHHLIAVTAAESLAVAFGMPAENIFPIWDWVGGRYSLWSAIGLPLLLLIGPQQFTDFLQGAHEMDEHFLHAEFKQNMPVILACLSIWYTNFFHARAHAIIPYAYRLRELVNYLQQTEMESNGKSVDLTGNSISYATSPVIFGQEGSLGQHAYHQLLHQGQHLIPVDFIVVDKAARSFMSTQESTAYRQSLLIANTLSQAHALLRGKSYDEAYHDLLKNNDVDTATKLAPHLQITGNKPSNIISLEALTPHSLGALLALYEHKIFVQGVIWNINSFDQWGVELGKSLLKSIMASFDDTSHSPLNTHLLAQQLQGI